jgi:type VI secretion system protein ImpA
MAAAGARSIDNLLAPVSADAPAGVNPRENISPSSPYLQLKDARDAARRAERRAETDPGQDQGLLAEWQTILTLAPKVLAEQAKDLQIAVWYLEALVRARGFAGLHDGFRLLRGLVDSYWETMFSLEEEGEEALKTRLSPIDGLDGGESDGALIAPLRKVPITAPGDPGPFSFYHLEQAWALSQISDAAVRAKRVERGAVTLEQFNAAANASGGRYYVTLIADIEGCIAEHEGLTEALDALAGYDSPSSTKIRDLLRAIADAVTNASRDLVARYRQANPAAAAAAVDETPGDAAVSEPPGPKDPMNPSGVLRNREEALEVLTRVATYFSTAEPQSPISESLQDLVRKARLPFSELMAELIPDASALRMAFIFAGIKPPKKEG